MSTKVKRTVALLVTMALILSCGVAQAQFGSRLNRAVQNAAERTAIRKAEEKTEQAVSNAIDKATEKGVQAAEKGAEKGVQAAEKGIEKGVEAAEKASAAQSDPQPQPDPYTGPIRGGAVDASKFPFEYGSYVEVAEALGVEAQSTIYFNRSGDWKAIEVKQELKVWGMTTKVDQMHIIKGNQHWKLDFIEKTGSHYELDSTPEETNALVSAALGGEPEEGMVVIDLGEEVWMGYPCKKSQVKYPGLAMDVVCLSYGTLIMKCDGRVGPVKTATRIISIDLNAPPASKFEVPAGINISND